MWDMQWLQKILIVISVLYGQAILGGCARGTPVFTGQYLAPIENLYRDLSIVAFTSDWKFVYTSIRYCAVPHRCRHLVKITFEGGESVTVHEYQKFLLFGTHEWTLARHLVRGSRLVRIGSDPCIVADVCDAPEDYLYEIDVGGPHTFFITRWCILTHNADLSLLMQTVTTDGILASVAGTSFCTTLATMLTSCGIKASVTGGVLSLSTPVTGPFVVAACAGACAGYLFYRMYEYWYGFLSMSRVREVVKFAERVKPSIIQQVETGYQEKSQQYVHQPQSIQSAAPQQLAQPPDLVVDEAVSLLCMRQPITIVKNEFLIVQYSDATDIPYILLYQKQKAHQNNPRKENRNFKGNQPSKKPPHNKDHVAAGGDVDTIRGSVIVKAVHETYEFVKQQWQECKDTCHNVMNELSKLGKRCFKCKGPAFRANYKDNPKHGAFQKGNISPRPKNGEHAMYNSVALDKESPRRRFGTSNGEIVELKSSGNNPQNEYHGYVVQWNELAEDIQQFLIDAGLTNKKGCS